MVILEEMYQDLANLTVTVLAIAIFLWLARGRCRLRLPPSSFEFQASPGNRRRAPWEVYKEWSDSCGSALIHLTLHRSDVVVINKTSAAQELMEGQHSHNYSSRPKLHMMDLIGRQNNVVVQPYGPRLRIARRLINETFGSWKSEEWMPVIQNASVELLSRILSDPEDFRQSVQQYVGSFIVRLTYGQDLEADYLHLVDEVSQHTSQAAIPGRWWVNSYPVLKYYPMWAPGGNFQRWAKEARKSFHEFTSKPFNRVREELLRSPNSFPYSFVHKNLSVSAATDPQMESIIAGTAGSLYSAAVDTTTSILTIFFLIMVTHPQVQAKASAEIGQVVGRDRLPDFEDAANLPYVEALIKELHRYHPVVPLLTRSTSNTDEYEGLHIPHGAWILTNIWGITHDKDEYEEPSRFDPERYIRAGHGYDQGAYPRDPRDFTFGMGRRRCPGTAIANAAIYLAVTGVLAAFSIEPLMDELGGRLIPPLEFTQATISSPMAFRCFIQPRHDRVKNLVEQARMGFNR